MPRLHRIARWTGTGVVAVLLMVATVVVVVETEWFKNWLRLKLVNSVAAVLDGELRVGRLGGSLWTGVTLDQVELVNRDGAVVTADHIRVRYDPFTLARRKWIVDHVTVERANISVIQTADGWNVQHLTKPRPLTAKRATVFIRKIELHDATVTIDSLKDAPRVLTDVDLDSSLTVTEGTTSMTFDRLHAVDETTGLTLHDTSGTAAENFREFDLTFTADSASTAIGGTAHGEVSESARVLTADLRTEHVNLAQLLARQDLASDITGHAIARATIPSAGGPARLEFNFSGPGSRAFGYTAESIEATGEVAGGAVTFDSRVSAYGARATVHGIWRWPSGTRGMSFAGRGTFASLDVSRLPPMLRLPKLDSDLAGKFDASVVGGGGWKAHATFSGGVVEGATINSGTEGNVSSSAGVTWYGAVGSASHVNVQRFGRTVPVAAITTARFDSDLSGEFFVAGRTSAGAPPMLVGGAMLTDSTISGTAVSALNAITYLEDRRLAVSASGRFKGLNAVTLDLPQTSVAATGEVTGWFAIADIDQPITEDNLELVGRVDLTPSSLDDLTIDTGVIDARLMDGVLTLNDVDVRNADGAVRASGQLGIREPMPNSGIAVTADIRNRDFIARTVKRPVMAVGTIEATITGTTVSPSATGTIAANQVEYTGVFSALTSNARFSVDWPERNVDRLTLKVESTSSFVTLANNEIQTLTAAADGTTREMAIDVRAEQKTRSIGIEGRLALLPEARELLLKRLALTTENIAWTLQEGQTALLRHSGDSIDVSDLTLVRGTQRIAVSGGFSLATDTGAASAAKTLSLQIHEVELADINHAMLGTRQLTGRINGAVTIGGTRQQPKVDGDVTIRDGLVQSVPYQSVQARGKYVGGVATIDAQLDQAPGATVRANGTVPISKDAAANSMNLVVTGGPVSLGLVQAFTTEIDKVAGDVALDLRVTGAISDPVVNGKATLTNGAFDVKATGVRYQAIEAAMDFEQSQMAIRHLQVADASGDLLTATGGLDVHRTVANRAVDIKVSAKSFSVLANRFGTAEMNADVQVSGQLTAPVVKGTVTLEGGRLEVAEILAKTTATPYSTTPQAAPGAEKTATPAATPWDQATIALQVRLPDNLVLRGRGLRVANRGFGIGDMNIITGGNFDITKQPAAPIDVRGALEVVHGTYTFQGRRFEIERGSDVRFRSSDLADPLININATREVAGVIAEVRLRGSARTPELNLSSRPPLDESDILSLIVFNQPVSSLGTAEQANLGERAAQMAAGAIASPLADSIGRALNLDVFEIQAPTSEDGTGAVTIGSQLGSRVLVGLKQQFGRGEASMLTLEYRVNELLRFVTSVASGTLQAHATRRVDRGGVDLLFVIRY